MQKSLEVISKDLLKLLLTTPSPTCYKKERTSKLCWEASIWSMKYPSSEWWTQIEALIYCFLRTLNSPWKSEDQPRGVLFLVKVCSHSIFFSEHSTKRLLQIQFPRKLLNSKLIFCCSLKPYQHLTNLRPNSYPSILCNQQLLVFQLRLLSDQKLLDYFFTSLSIVYCIKGWNFLFLSKETRVLVVDVWARHRRYESNGEDKVFDQECSISQTCQFVSYKSDSFTRIQGILKINSRWLVLNWKNRIFTYTASNIYYYKFIYFRYLFTRRIHGYSFPLSRSLVKNY